MNKRYGSTKELPGALPVFPLSACLLLPRSELPLNIFESRYLAMVDAALARDRLIGMIQPAEGVVLAGTDDLYSVGCVGRLTRFAETGDGRYLISLEGVCRFRLAGETTCSTPYRVFNVDFSAFADDLNVSEPIRPSERAALMRALRAFAERHNFEVDWDSIERASDETLVNALAMMSPFGAREKQALLEAENLGARAAALIAIAEFDLASVRRGGGPIH